MSQMHDSTFTLSAHQKLLAKPSHHDLMRRACGQHSHAGSESAGGKQTRLRLQRFAVNRAETARMLGVSRTTLYRFLEKHEVLQNTDV